MTENGEMSLKVFGSNAVLCRSSIDPETERYFTADWSTFQTLDMNKRISYEDAVDTHAWE